MRIITISLVCFMVVSIAGIAPVLAQESSPQEEEEKKTEEKDLEALRRAADVEATKEEEAKDTEEKIVFESGNLGLQALNPEISVTGDMLGNYQSGDDDAVDWNTVFRTLGLHLEAYLDPYSRFKAAVPVSTEGVELGEAYFTRYGLPGNTNATLGKFRQQFGVVNRWHKHGLDWFDFPLALRSVFGPGGLNQIGLSLEWGASTGPVTHGLMAQVNDGANPRIFGRNTRNRPSILGRYTAYQDLSPSTYLDIGLTGLVGWNDAWTTVETLVDTTIERSFDDPRLVAVYGADLVLVWEPTGRMRYRNIQWRSEAYFVNKEIYAPDNSGRDRLNPWGFYSLIQAKVSRTVEIGIRYDYFEPETKDYASLNDELSLVPLAVTESDAYRHLVGTWLTWWQSPFVKFRCGYSYEDGTGTGPDTHLAQFQIVFAAGPHKHERY
ncbi:MAG: hypothetical protein JSW58_16360 [Candidatus Latescibacterota bacterium]|nr:MAG: hypothetical protein JSW58_16360 [Candidatus Latescibacterota bacterium]